MSKGITVLAAFDSVTMRSMIVNLLKEKGYDVLEAADGKEALEILLRKKIDCIIAYIDLKQVNGYGISRIIKNTKGLEDIVVILSSTEDNSVFRFWAESSKSNQFYVARPNNGDYLEMLIDTSIEDRGPRKETDLSDLQKKVFHEIIQCAYDKELFDLYIVSNAFKAVKSIFDFNTLLNRMSECLSGVCEYDAAAILINDEPLIQRFYRKGPISDQDYKDFMLICHSDFKSRIPTRKEYKWEQSNFEEDTIENTFEENQKVKSYEVFPLERDENNPLTFHVASCQEDAFSKRARERLNYFATVYSTLIENAVIYHKAKTSEEKMRNSFSRFLPPKIINDIVAGKTSVSDTIGENRKVAVLIADIRDFTSISEINPPDKVVDFLNYFFGIMGEIIKRHGGTIDKFMGDCIMALFGAPDSYVDNGIRAANAALEMIQAQVDTSLIKLPENYTFDFGIGIHYGDMIVGTIGSNEKKDYTVIGDNVNIASRIEGLTKVFGTRIIVTEDVKSDIDRYTRNSQEGTDKNNIPYFMRHLGVVTVKGRNKPVKIFEIGTDSTRYSKSFMDRYAKGLDRWMDHDLNGALEYFKNAAAENPEDKACQFCIQQCLKHLNDDDSEKWDGSFRLLVK